MHTKNKGKPKNDTCAWTPNKINLEFKNADCVCLSTGASREAPVDNECFGQLGWPSKGCLGNFLKHFWARQV